MAPRRKLFKGSGVVSSDEEEDPVVKAETAWMGEYEDKLMELELEQDEEFTNTAWMGKSASIRPSVKVEVEVNEVDRELVKVQRELAEVEASLADLDAAHDSEVAHLRAQLPVALSHYRTLLAKLIRLQVLTGV